jgi:hypothetical protein
MKTLFCMAAACLLSMSVMAQTSPVVTINVKGNRITKVGVDGKFYEIGNSSAAEEQQIVLPQLSNGTHSLDIVRTNQNGRSISDKTSFTLRENYDLVIQVQPNGSVTSEEAHVNNRSDEPARPVTTAVFNKFYNQVKRKTSSTSRAALLETEFTTGGRKFTSAQVSKLIQLVNSESLRLKLGRLSYVRVTDKQNFSQVVALLKSTANRNELNAYIASQPADNDGTLSGTPLTDEKFRVIYNEVVAERYASDRQYYLSNFFAKDFNFYTTAQARQLIEIISDDAGRFTLAKAAYRGVVDKSNYYNQLAPLLGNASDRTALLAYIGTGGSTAGTAMSTADFDKLYQTAYYQNTNNRYVTINNALTTPGNFFTAAQALKLIQLVNTEANRLVLSKKAYGVLVDRHNFSQLYVALNTSSRTELKNYVATYDGTYSSDIAMNETEFDRISNSIRNAWGTSAKLSAATQTFNNPQYRFSTAQVRQLLMLISAESDRLTLARIAWDNVVDPNNYNQLYDVFSSQANRNELTAFINGTEPATTVRTPMTDDEFNRIYRNIQFTFGLGAKMSSLSDLFKKETNFFTVAQAKKADRTGERGI